MTLPAPSKSRKPPARRGQPERQYELFTQFFGEGAELSNTIELWDAIPKYAVTARRQGTLRDGKNRLPVHEYAFECRKRLCRVEIQPAPIKEEGGFVDYYPSTAEELVEEVIRKIFTDQRYGLHIAAESESWVQFSLQMIRRELEARGKRRSLREIKRSIEILAKSTISLYVEGEEDPIYTNTILSDLTRVSRSAYLDDPGVKWAARLPALISKSVNDVTYRQFDYGTLMAMQSQLARWLHKRLSHNYTNASFLHNYEIRFSTLKRDSGLLEKTNITKNLGTVDSALDELVAGGVLSDWEKQERRGERNKLDDVLYVLKADGEFIAQVKAANARQGEHRRELDGQGHAGRSRLRGGR